MSKTTWTRTRWATLAFCGVTALLLASSLSGAEGFGGRGSRGANRRPEDRSEPGHAGRARPNFVFILTDDMDAASLQHMPRTRRLIGGCGATFNNMFVVNPVCCPSSVSMLTGQYSHNNQILHNVPPQGGFQKFVDIGGDTSTLATWLHDGGYLTGRVGKYLVGYPTGTTYIPPGWDDWRSTYEGFTSYYNYALNENGAVVPYGAEAGDYITDVLSRKAVDFLAGAEANDRQPFFLVFSTTAPHAGEGQNGPPTPAPRHLGRFAGVTAPRPPSFNEADVSDKPPAIATLPPLTAAQIAAIDQEYQARLESLQAVDEAVEQIVDALEFLGELENTYLIFTSDNGYHLGQHRLRNGKAQVYEEDIRVPLLIRGPGVPRGVERDQFALNIDFAPTICDLAGVIPGRVTDGRSLVPLLHRRTPPPHAWRKDFLVEVYRVPAQPGEPSLALRTRDELYVEFPSGLREYYDLRNDPFQLENLSTRTAPVYFNRFSRRLAELANSSGDGCNE